MKPSEPIRITHKSSVGESALVAVRSRLSTGVAALIAAWRCVLTSRLQVLGGVQLGRRPAAGAVQGSVPVSASVRTLGSIHFLTGGPHCTDSRQCKWA